MIKLTFSDKTLEIKKDNYKKIGYFNLNQTNEYDFSLYKSKFFSDLYQDVAIELTDSVDTIVEKIIEISFRELMSVEDEQFLNQVPNRVSHYLDLSKVNDQNQLKNFIHKLVSVRRNIEIIESNINLVIIVNDLIKLSCALFIYDSNWSQFLDYITRDYIENEDLNYFKLCFNTYLTTDFYMHDIEKAFEIFMYKNKTVSKTINKTGISYYILFIEKILLSTPHHVSDAETENTRIIRFENLEDNMTRSIKDFIEVFKEIMEYDKINNKEEVINEGYKSIVSQYDKLYGFNKLNLELSEQTKQIIDQVNNSKDELDKFDFSKLFREIIEEQDIDYYKIIEHIISCNIFESSEILDIIKNQNTNSKLKFILINSDLLLYIFELMN